MLSWKPPKYYIVKTLDELQVVCDVVQKQVDKDAPLAIDVETTGAFPKLGLDYYHSWLLGISIAPSIHEGYYIPLNHIIKGKRDKNQLTVNQIVDALNPIMSTKGLYLGHNLKFDYKFLWQAGLTLYPRLWDTSVAIQLINGDAYMDRALKKIIRKYVDIPFNLVQSFEDVANGDAALTTPEEMVTYAVNDVIYVHYLYNVFKPIVDNRFKKLFYTELALIPILAQTELKGIKLDKDYFKKIHTPLEKYKNQIHSFIKNKYDINVASVQQVAKVFNNFDHLHLQRKKDTNNIVTDVEALRNIMSSFPAKDEVYKLAKRVLKFREVNKAVNTYITKFPKICDTYYKDNKQIHILHTDFNQIVNSGRLSSRPNIQNIPRNILVDIRKGFVARDGYSFIEADWASAELRLAAIVSNEPKMVNAYTKDPLGADLHAMTARGVFKKSKVTKDERHIGKTLNFSLLYGATEFAVSRTLKCTKEEAMNYVQGYYETYPHILKWKLALQKIIDKQGYSTTLYGRRRYLTPGVYNGMHDEWKYRGAIRELTNHIIQGTCADLLKFSMVSIVSTLAKLNLPAYLITTTHDSIMIEAKDEIAEQVKSIIKGVMEVTINNIFMPVDIEIKKSFSKG